MSPPRRKPERRSPDARPGHRATNGGDSRKEFSEPGPAVPEPERKERVLHTRVPESLDRQLRRRARNLGLSVSTVVRHVLLNTFGLVEDIVTDSTNIALSIAGAGDSLDVADGEVTRAARVSRVAGTDQSGAEVVAWNEAILNRNAVCEQCNGILAKGSRAAVGVRERPGPGVFLCRTCLQAVSGDVRRVPAARGRAAARSGHGAGVLTRDTGAGARTRGRRPRPRES